MHVDIRRGERSDARAAADLWLRSRAASLESIPPPAHADDDVREWFATHVVAELELWVAESAPRRIVGLMVLDGDWLDQLYVEPSCTGRGIGRRLLEVALSLRPQGLQLWTFAANTRAQRFYERHGFRAVERTDGSANEERAPDIRYVHRPPGRG